MLRPVAMATAIAEEAGRDDVFPATSAVLPCEEMLRSTAKVSNLLSREPILARKGPGVRAPHRVRTVVAKTALAVEREITKFHECVPHSEGRR